LLCAVWAAEDGGLQGIPHRLRRRAMRTQGFRETVALGGVSAGPTLAKPTDMNATEARIALLAQHEQIRRQLEACTRLAKLHRAGQKVGSELEAALGQLREKLGEHNQDETAIIGQLLHGPAAWGSLLVDRMLEEHVAEHAVFWGLLSGTHAEIAERIDDLVDELDAHMAAEERTFLSPVTLRDDVIRVRTREHVSE
jgi:iron-sulfur cluster repair protein YtfE (RIC family)